MTLPHGRRGNPEALASPSEKSAFTTLVYQLNWVGKETRPEVAGSSSLLASKVKEPAIKDVTEAKAAANLFRSSAAQKIVIWPIPPEDLRFSVVSDSAGAGSADGERAQGAWLVLSSERGLADGDLSRVSPMAWRSSRLRRVVSSTLAGETLALCQGVAEMEWLQAIWQDVAFNRAVRDGCENQVLDFSVILREAGPLGSVAVVDAKSVFDTLVKSTAGSKQDRRTSIDLALLRDRFAKEGISIRWVPHPLMPSDMMTKSDVRKGNAALSTLLRSGKWKLLDEKAEAQERHSGMVKPVRSQAASRRELLAAGLA